MCVAQCATAAAVAGKRVLTGCAFVCVPTPCVFSPSGSKDTVQNKTETEKKLGRILSNENWGASSTAMNEIAALTRD